MNKVFLIGNLTRDPEVSETSGGIPFCRLGIAVPRTYSSNEGEKITDFFNVTVWRNQAENCGRFLKKGSKVSIFGSLQNRSYDDKDGNKRQVTDIIASEVEFLSAKGQTDGSEEDFHEEREIKKPTLEQVDDDLPF